MKTKLKDAKGFTIIEVLIVLAIAGLIMLIVFMAIPALRRNQQNTTMRSEATRILSQATEYESNANGQKVNDDARYNAVVSGAGMANFTQLSTTDTDHTYGVGATTAGQTRLVIGTCDGTAALAGGPTTRTYALQFTLVGDQQACIQS